MFSRSTLFATALATAYAQAYSSEDAYEIQSVGGYSSSEAMISVQLSGDAYCGKDAYMNHSFTGTAKGFVVTKVLYDSGSDTEGYVGYLPSDSSIYVVYRGSSSIPNWITNFDATQATYTKWPTCNCKVHAGFDKAVTAVYSDVISAVKSIQKTHPTYKVKTTGHSLGAALAQLTAMSLLADGVTVSMVNFGQPRLGDTTYASFSGTKLTN